MSTPQRDDRLPIQDFLQWKDAQSTGRQGTQGAQNDGRPKYIPYSVLATYMRRPNVVEKLLGALFPDGHDAPDADSIRNHWLRPFAILISINHGWMINAFCRRDDLEDEKLPLRSEPSNFPKSSTIIGGRPVNLWELFSQHQWEFCPKKLEYNMESVLHENDILPFEVVGNRVGRGGSSDIYKITVNDEYNQLLPSRDDNMASSLLPTNTFIIKTFRGREAEDYYNTERKAFKQLTFGNKPPSNIIGFHGSFIRNNIFNIILEYANLGDLEKFMRVTPSPVDGAEVLLLWERVCGLFQGLLSIHGIGKVEHGNCFMLGWHQDIKPSNILVRRRPGHETYDCDFLIADLGLSHFKSPTPPQRRVADRDTFGTKAYGAPETYRVPGVNDQIHIIVGQGVDNWSLGCVLSEVATWIVLGIASVEEYQHRRQKEASKPDKLGPGTGALFHDGTTVLDTVRDNHTNLAEHRRIDDFVTVDIVEKLIADMIVEADSRSTTLFYASKSNRIIREARKKLERSKSAPDSNVPSTPTPDAELNEFLPMSPTGGSINHTALKTRTSASPGHATVEQPEAGPTGDFSRSNGYLRPSSGSSPRQPQLSVDTVLEWKKQKLGIRRHNLPDKNLLTDIKKRDHVFLMDNSASMDAYRKEAGMVIKAIGYMVKKFDPDGMDMFFTQSEKVLRKSRKTKPFLKALNTADFLGLTDMRSQFGAVTEDYKSKVAGTNGNWVSKILAKSSAPRRLSLYVLTDGNWQPGCDLAPTIKSLVNKLEENDRIEKQVAIQFIRFGGIPEGMKELERLDSGLGLRMDIVDTTANDGNVWKMLLGGMNPWFDDDKTQQSPDVGSSYPPRTTYA